MSFNRAVQFTLGIEGGYNNDPTDKGGETNLGITSLILKEGIRLGIVAKGTNIKDITVAQAMSIYDAVFWDKFGLDTVPWPISLLLFDSAVHHGQDDMASIAQRAVNTLNKAEGKGLLKVDGKWGPLTRAAVLNRAATESVRLAMSMLLERKLFIDRIFTKSPSQLKFRNGWYKRLRELAQEAGVQSPV